MFDKDVTLVGKDNCVFYSIIACFHEFVDGVVYAVVLA